MRKISYIEQKEALQSRYPHAFVEPFDNKVLALTAEGWQAMHREFHFWLGMIYEAEIGDCDDFMREFHAYVKRRHRAGDFSDALGCYDLIYLINSQASRKHAINTVWVVAEDGSEVYLSELEPQPEGGLFLCTDIEKQSASFCLG